MEDPKNQHTPPPALKSTTIEISIIIPAFNESKFIGLTLESLKNNKFPKNKYEIIVVDNGSTDNTANIAKSLADIVSILPDANVGAVRNHGVTLASGKLLAFIDADCTVEDDWLENIYELESQHHDHQVFGGLCKVRTGANWIERLWILEGERRHQKDLTGACIVVSKEAFYSVNGFNERLTSGEDTEFSQTLRESGKTVIIRPELNVTHLGNAKTIKDFITRQAWHSENYLQDLTSSLKDPTFLACSISLLSLGALAFYSVTTLNFWPIVLGVAITLATPVIFSLKRLAYSGYKPKSKLEYIKIYTLDFIYVIGRWKGILKSATRLIIKRSN